MEDPCLPQPEPTAPGRRATSTRPGEMQELHRVRPLLLGLAAPEAVLFVLPGVRLAGKKSRALQADPAGFRLAVLPCPGALTVGGEKEASVTNTIGVVHPLEREREYRPGCRQQPVPD